MIAVMKMMMMMTKVVAVIMVVAVLAGASLKVESYQTECSPA